MTKKREQIGIRKLRGIFDRFATNVLQDTNHINEIFVDRGPRRFEILRELPNKKEYEKLRDNKYRQPLAEVIGEAYSEFSTLRDELQEWYDNLPENFQNGDKGSEVQEAIDQLEAFCDDEPNLGTELKQIMEDQTAVFLPFENCRSRSDRCAYAKYCLDTVVTQLRENDTLRKSIKETDVEDEAKELADELDNHATEAENVSFPGMYS